MARTVEDTALLLEAVAGYDGIDDRQLGAPTRPLVPNYVQDLLATRKEGIKGLKIGLLKEGMSIPRLQPGVLAAVEHAVETFKALGAQVDEVSIPMHAEIRSAMTVINKLGSSQTRQGRQCGRRGLYINDYFERLLP